MRRHDRAGFQPVDIIPFVEVEIDDVKITRDDVFRRSIEGQTIFTRRPRTKGVAEILSAMVGPHEACHAGKMIVVAMGWKMPSISFTPIPSAVSV